MNVKKLFLILLLTFFISEQSFSREYNCKISRTIPSLDLNQLPIKEGVIDIDFERRTINYWQMLDVQIYNLKFENNLATWLHTFINPVSGKKELLIVILIDQKKNLYKTPFLTKKI